MTKGSFFCLNLVISRRLIADINSIVERAKSALENVFLDKKYHKCLSLNLVVNVI